MALPLAALRLYRLTGRRRRIINPAGLPQNSSHVNVTTTYTLTVVQ